MLSTKEVFPIILQEILVHTPSVKMNFMCKSSLFIKRVYTFQPVTKRQLRGGSYYD